LGKIGLATAHKDWIPAFAGKTESAERRPEQGLKVRFKNYRTIILVLFSQSLIRRIFPLLNFNSDHFANRVGTCLPRDNGD
jgi:hypothetical protein